ncbi:MAG: fatty acid desaturase [Rhodobacteraceae bacterium]|nr:MAG: fatty acid desaturase [Paracoccaceae bacterium]
MTKRDYSLLGPEARRAVETGLATAQWYHTEIPRKEMKALMQRSDQPAIRDTVLLFGSMLVLAAIGIALWPSWASAPFWLGYGVLYCSAMDSRWHECGHGTAFRTPWMNNVLYQIASFCMVRNPVEWRWSHARHHTDTVIVGRDPEIVAMRPPALLRIFLNFFGILDALTGWKRMLLNAAGRIDPAEASFIPEPEQPKVIRVARIWVLIYAATLGLALWMQSILPLMLIGLPRLYGAWHHVLTGLMQHAGLAEDVLDHRLNSRTVYINPVSRFIYWNMNYHVEHHMFPMVPYHRLPELHEKIKHDLPAANPSMLDAYREIWPALKRQLRYEDHFIKRALPATARPYREDLHAAALSAPAA